MSQDSDLVACSYCDGGVQENQTCSNCGVCNECEDFCDYVPGEDLCWAC